MRNAAIKALFNQAQMDRDIILVCGDLGYGVLDEFEKALPEQFINAGICEQNMAAMAAGLAYEGKKVFLYSIGNFPTLRCMEQIRNDIAYHKVNVNIMAIGCGVSYGNLGMSHHATEDIAALRALPEMTVFAPGDALEAEKVVEAACRLEGPTYIRLGKAGEPKVHTKLEGFEVGRAIKIKDGGRVCILTTGGILAEAQKAALTLSENGIPAALYSFPTVKPIDAEAVRECASRFELIATVEEHNILGGFGGAVAEVMAELPGSRARLKRFGLNDIYSSAIGDQAYLREYYGISAGKIAAGVTELLKGDA